MKHLKNQNDTVLKKKIPVLLRISYGIAMTMLFSCSNIELHPYQVFDDESPRNLNIQQYQRLSRTIGDDTVTIAFAGDTQRFYDELNLFVKKVNQLPDVDFVMLAGDISDFGLLQELEWINRELNDLRAPYFAVVGNHDVLGNGEKVFKRYFGSLDYSFNYKDYKFILHNTNSREYASANVPDIDWLTKELNDQSSHYIVGVSHVPPYDNDFNRGLEKTYSMLLSSSEKLILSLHGHQHRKSDGYPYNDSVRYIVTDDFEGRNFILLKLFRGTVWKSRISY